MPSGRLTVAVSSSGRPMSDEDDEEDEDPSSARPFSRRRSAPSASTIPMYFYVLPVLLLEFLALALTRAVLPGLLLQQYGRNVYLILGCAECIRGCLAFFACPLFGQVSDHVGRKPCLLVTVLGTCAPVCSLALWSWQALPIPVEESLSTLPATYQYTLVSPEQALTVFVLLLAISGFTSSTFTLVFCYISDTVASKDERLSAYGLALATFGLSFTLGTLCGGYLAETGNPANIFRASCVLTVLDLIYVAWILPESKPNPQLQQPPLAPPLPQSSNTSSISVASTTTTSTRTVLIQQLAAWKPLENIQQTLWKDPFLRNVGMLAFLYYTGLSAVISTISLYAVSHFHLSPQRLGELMSALGACTMLAEAVLVRFLVPYWGERTAIRMGLLSFACQCLVLGMATQPWQLFICVGFSLLANLVYPSLSSLVTELVEPDKVGEALGSLNGVKALTEGIGPLIFGLLFTWSEDITAQYPSIPPGWPYCVAALVVLGAYQVATDRLPRDDGDDCEYIHELEFKQRTRKQRYHKPSHSTQENDVEEEDCTLLPRGCIPFVPVPAITIRDDEEYQDLLPRNLESSGTYYDHSRHEEEDDIGDDDDSNNGTASFASPPLSG